VLDAQVVFGMRASAPARRASLYTPRPLTCF